MSTPQRSQDNRTKTRHKLAAAVGASAILVGALAMTGGGAFAIQPPADPAAGDPAPAPPEPPGTDAAAYDEAAIRLGLRIWQEKINCGTCHGWNGAGEQDDPRSPPGANLREMLLTPDQFAEVVNCGRIGTLMPAFDARAYVDDRCFGLTEEQLGDQTPEKRGTYLIKREVDALVAYVYSTMVGAEGSTREECNDYWAVGAPICEAFPPAVAP